MVSTHLFCFDLDGTIYTGEKPGVLDFEAKWKPRTEFQETNKISVIECVEYLRLKYKDCKLVVVTGSMYGNEFSQSELGSLFDLTVYTFYTNTSVTSDKAIPWNETPADQVPPHEIPKFVDFGKLKVLHIQQAIDTLKLTGPITVTLVDDYFQENGGMPEWKLFWETPTISLTYTKPRLYTTIEGLISEEKDSDINEFLGSYQDISTLSGRDAGTGTGHRTTGPPDALLELQRVQITRRDTTFENLNLRNLRNLFNKNENLTNVVLIPTSSGCRNETILLHRILSFSHLNDNLQIHVFGQDIFKCQLKQELILANEGAEESSVKMIPVKRYDTLVLPEQNDDMANGEDIDIDSIFQTSFFTWTEDLLESINRNTIVMVTEASPDGKPVTDPETGYDHALSLIYKKCALSEAPVIGLTFNTDMNTTDSDDALQKKVKMQLINFEITPSAALRNYRLTGGDMRPDPIQRATRTILAGLGVALMAVAAFCQ